MIHEYFPQEYVELQKELLTGYHTKLVELLQKHPQGELDVILAEIATYCEVILDGTYTLEERRKLCDILRKRLVAKRERPGGILLLN